MKTIDTSSNNIQIRVVGKNSMQNELMVTYLNEKTGMPCSQTPHLNLPITNNITEKNYSIVFLLDAKGMDLNEVWYGLSDRMINRYTELIFLIYNLDSDENIAIEAVKHGIRGIFFNDEPLDIILKGIKAILDGEMWFSRKILAKCIMTSKKLKSVPGDTQANLTQREREILLKIFLGESNQEISDSLCISYHTVKTHVYNIYRKINTSDRFQATLWAAKHL